MDYLKKIFGELKRKWRKNEQAEKIRRLYEDIASILWFDSLINGVFADNPRKRALMQRQKLNFRIYTYGNKCLHYGCCIALYEAADIQKFVSLAEANLLDAGFGHCKVEVFGQDGIRVTKL